MKAVDVAEPTIVGLRDHRQPPRLQRGAPNAPLQNGVAHHAHAVRVGNADRPLEKSALLQPGGSGHLAVAVEREPGTEYGIVAPFPAGVHYGHAGTYRSDPHLEWSWRALDDRGVADFNTAHIGDGIQGAGGSADQGGDAQVARAGARRGLRAGLLGRYRGGEQRSPEAEHSNGQSGPNGLNEQNRPEDRRHRGLLMYSMVGTGETRCPSPNLRCDWACRQRGPPEGAPEGAARQRKTPHDNSLRGLSLARTGWDSNPRYAFTYTHFPGVRLKPLSHPSSCTCLIPPTTTTRWHANPRTSASGHASTAADRVRFELTIPLPVRRFSRPVPSTTRPPIQDFLLA